MASSVKNKNCKSGKCKSASVTQARQIRTNGKGDKPRPFLKNQYDKNYESINWKRK